MLEDLGRITARIAEIQESLASLSAPAAAPVAGSAPAAGSAEPFSQTLQRVQNSAVPAARPAEAPPAPVQTRLPETRAHIAIPPASLGPLPVSPADVRVVPPAHPASYGGLIQTYAGRHNLPPSLVQAVIQTESGGNPHAVSRAGAMGLMQLMPENVREAGVTDPFDPEQNIAAGTKQLSDLMSLYHGDLELTLAGYNAGPGNVRKYGGVPPFAETQGYIRKVRTAMQEIEGGKG